MQLQLINGEFNAKETLDLLTQMVHIKIRYHEGNVLINSSEEDIKSRESKIKALQKELDELRKNIQANNKQYKIEGIINIVE